MIEDKYINKVIKKIRGLAVMLDTYLAEYGATVANFTTVQNQGS